ncbi:MAG: chloride channel protein [Limnochordia bacterium]
MQQFVDHQQRFNLTKLLPLRAAGRWLLLCTLLALPIGTASALFLAVLNHVTAVSSAKPWLLLFLPLSGLITAYVYQRYGGAARQGMTLILDEAIAPKQPIPLRMTFLIAWGTLMTLLGGGSAGIEATGVQMACGLADPIGRKLKLTPAERPILITGAVAAGFGSIFGTPVAGAIFAVEIMRQGAPRYGALLPSLLCAVLADRVTTQLWGIPRYTYAHTLLPPIEAGIWFKVAIAGVVLGLVARLFVTSVRAMRTFARQHIAHPLLRPAAGGVIVILLTLLVGTRAYNGLGTETVDLALQGADVPLLAPFLKIIFTAVTIGFGFIGGEVAPLFFVGATAGNALAGLLGLPADMMAKLGFVALLAGGTNTPVTGIMIGMELFGGETPVYPATACILAYVFSGSRGIYSPSTVQPEERAPLRLLLDAMLRPGLMEEADRFGTGEDLHAGVG